MGANTQEVTTTTDPRITTVRNELEKHKALIVQSMSKYLDPARMMAVFMVTVQKNPKLLDCTRESLFGALVTAAQLGLEIDSTTNQAHILPYKDKATLIVGYKGLETLAMRTGLVHRIVPRVVYEGDEFDYNYGIRPNLTHVEKHKTKNLVFVYATVYFTNGDTEFKVLDKEEVHALRKRSPSFGSGSGPWFTDEAAMWCVKAVRQICKIIPNTSIEGNKLHAAVAIDERIDAGLPQNLHVVLDPNAVADPEVPEQPAAAPEPKRASEKAAAPAAAETNEELDKEVAAPPPAKAKTTTPRDNMKAMKARWKGKCADCGKEIPQGEMMYFDRKKSKAYCHERCA